MLVDVQWGMLVRLKISIEPTQLGVELFKSQVSMLSHFEPVGVFARIGLGIMSNDSLQISFENIFSKFKLLF